MNYSRTTATYTLIKSESRKIVECWAQTLLPSVITTTLYFLIFGNLVGSRIGTISNMSYSEFIAPGLIMLAIITNSYLHVSNNFYLSKFTKNIEEILVSPMSNTLIILGFTCSGIIRGTICALLVTGVSFLFIPINHTHASILIIITALTTTMFSLLGLINGIYADDFEDIFIIPTFVLTPLTYLGGVFYSITMLPEIWQKISQLNPILYMVNIFRYGMVGVSDVPIANALIIIIIIDIVLFYTCIYLLKKSNKIKK